MGRLSSLPSVTTSRGLLLFFCLTAFLKQWIEIQTRLWAHFWRSPYDIVQSNVPARQEAEQYMFLSLRSQTDKGLRSSAVCCQPGDDALRQPVSPQHATACPALSIV